MRLWRRKRAKLVVLGCVLILGAAAFVLDDEGPYVPSGVLTPNEIDVPRVIAHKTSGTDAPGNTLEAVRRLLATEIDEYGVVAQGLEGRKIR